VLSYLKSNYTIFGMGFELLQKVTNLRHILICVLFLSVFQNAQATEQDTVYRDSIRNIEYQLEGLSHNIINSRDIEERVTSCYYFIQTLKKALQVPTSFDYEFERLKTVSILKPEDEAFRLFTWNLPLDSGRYVYFGAMQMNSPDSLVLFGLYDSSHTFRQPEFEQVDHKHWIGALYYQIHTYSYKGEKRYLLFGWDGQDGFTNRKIIDVLHFDETGKPWFGLPIFEDDEDEYKHRLIHTYANQATMICRYSKEEKKIVFDHLSPVNPMLKGQYQYYVPDGTYDYMVFIKGFWQRQELLFDDADDQHKYRKMNDIQEPEPPKGVKPKKKRRKNKKAFN